MRVRQDSLSLRPNIMSMHQRNYFLSHTTVVLLCLGLTAGLLATDFTGGVDGGVFSETGTDLAAGVGFTAGAGLAVGLGVGLTMCVVEPLPGTLW